MSEILKKPYEISVWEDRLKSVLDQEGNITETYYDEVKIATIGSDKMTSQNRVYSPVFKMNTNGEKTLTFSLKYKYYDEMVGDFVVNPFERFLVNERKVKLFYDGEWYDFVIKEKEEESEEYTFSYTCTDLFVQELARNGYGITFSTELNNNQGTVTELAEKVLENTDWVVDKENSDILRQKICEPIYECVVTDSSFEALNTDTNELETINVNEIIYIFYSHIANKQTENIQFIRAADRDLWSYDSNNAIMGTNYRIFNSVEYSESSNPLVISYAGAHINIGDINTESQGYRLVYNNLTTYDPVMGKTIDIYEAEYDDGHKQQIYHYTETEYGTSSILTNYITNGSNFSTYNGANVTGWSNAVKTKSNDLLDVGIATYPDITTTQALASITQLKSINTYLELQTPLNEGDDKYQYCYYNSGLIDNASFINGINAGDKYLFRIRYRVAAGKHHQLYIKHNSSDVYAVIAGYKLKQKTLSDGSKITIKEIDPEKIYLNFEAANDSQKGIANIVISGGKIDNNNYVLNGVPLTPSTKYIYKVEGDDETEYIWKPGQNSFVIREYADNPSTETESDSNSYFADYFYLTAVAEKSISRSKLTDPSNRVGLFIYRIPSSTTQSNQYIYIEDIELTKYYEDANNKPIFIGSAPEAKQTTVHKYYLKPEEGATSDVIELYNSIEALADNSHILQDIIKPLKNEQGEKILSIEESKSNCFNILQSLCETFECWLKINVEHDETGKLKLNSNYRPNKRISFKEYVGKDNFAGFKYGINLSSINRSIDSEEFVTKLIVGQPTSEYTKSGILNIGEATANPSGESYILNFNYYINQGLIENKADFNKDLNQFNQDLKKKNAHIQFLNEQYISASAALEHAKANRNVYSETVEVASEKYAKALSDFEMITKMSYEDFLKSNPKIEAVEKNEALLKAIDDIYAAAVQVNNYSGLLTNINEEYKKLDLECNGVSTYGITITTSKSTETGAGPTAGTTKLVLSDYISGFKCDFYNKTSENVEWASGPNNKEYTDNIIYSHIRIKEIPENYELEYTLNGKNYRTSDLPVSIPICIVINEADSETIVEGMTRNLKIVPTSDYEKTKIGLKQEIENTIKEKNEIEKEFYSKYSRFIQEGTWESTDYIDNELYYMDALQVSNTSAQPKVSYTINVVEISEIKGYENYNFAVGDRTYIEDTDFFGWETYSENGVTTETPIKEIVVVSEVEWHLDEPETNIITVQNYKTQFEDLFQRISATVQSVEYNQASYARAASILDVNGHINPSLLVGSLNSVAGQGYNLTTGGVLKVTEEGIIIQNLTEPGNLLIIKGRGIERSTDGGVTWKNLISSAGVNTEELTSGSINTQNITVLDGKNPSFRWDANGISAFGQDEFGNYDLNTYVRYDKYGIYGIQNGEEYVATSLEDIKDQASFGLTWDGFFIKNKYRDGYVSISSTDDIQVVENDVERVRIGAIEFKADGITPERYGMKISNSEGESVLETDDNGNITMTGTIRAAAGQIGGFTIGEHELYNGNFGEDNSIFLSTGYESTVPIAGFDDKHTWAIGVGNNFGVDTSGNLYATNANISGIINATDGNFTGRVNAIGGTFLDEIKVGTGEKYIVLQGRNINSNSLIASSEYIENPSMGWAINGTGDAIFNNVSVRGAIRTAVFEYSEIEAVGGAFLFRPSSSIKNAIVSGNDLILTMEKPNLFQENEWVKLSNVNTESNGINDILNDGGLTHVYRIKSANGKEVVLADAALGFIPDTEATYGEWGEITESETGGREYTSITFEPPYTDEELEENPDLEYFPSYVDLKDNNNSFIQVDAPRYDVFFNGRGYIMELNAELETKDDGTTEIHYNEVEITSDTLERGQSGTYVVHKYIGNLYILSTDLENTTEDFIVADITYPNGERYSRIYSRMTGEREFVLKACDTNGSVDDLVGGSLISFGYYTNAYRPFVVPNWSSPKGLKLYELVEGNYVLTEDDTAVEGKTYYKEQYEGGIHNYGIGINSSDNYVNLPERAISLFETTIHPNESVKVSYDYKGILGTLPPLGSNIVNQNIYSNNMAGTQGIFTNNMYIGDASQYIAFYTDDNGDKQLKIKANQVVFEVADSETGESTWKDVSEIAEGAEGKDGENAINVVIDSSAGNLFYKQGVNSTLTCTVYSGSTDITDQVTKFTWKKKNSDGTIDSSWTRLLGGRTISISPSDVESKAIFICEVEF